MTDLDAPLRLDRAAELAFPCGGMTASGLMTEARRGNLVTERIAGKIFTTLREIQKMRERCRAKLNRPASGLDAEPDEIRNGSSSTTADSLAQARADTIARSLKKHSQNTSATGTRQRSATVIPIKSV